MKKRFKLISVILAFNLLFVGQINFLTADAAGFSWKSLFDKIKSTSPQETNEGDSTEKRDATEKVGTDSASGATPISSQVIPLSEDAKKRLSSCNEEKLLKSEETDEKSEKTDEKYINTKGSAYRSGDDDDDDYDPDEFLGSGTKDDPWKIGLTTSLASRSKVTAYIEGTELKISGSGVMKTYYSIKSETVKPREWQDENITKITIGENVKELGGYCFANMENLTEVKFESDNTYIAAGAFQNCTKLSSVNIPKNIEGLFGSTFWGCSALKSVSLSEGLDYIEVSCFRKSGLTKIEFPVSLTEIDAYSFTGTKISTLKIPKSVKKIGNSAFAECTILTKADIEYNEKKTTLKKLQDSLFYKCSKLTEVSIPNYINQIDNKAFKDTVLNKVVYNGTLNEWGNTIDNIGVENTKLTDAKLYYLTRIKNMDDFYDYVDATKEGDTSTTTVLLETDLDFGGMRCSESYYCGSLNCEFEGNNHVIKNLTFGAKKDASNRGFFKSLDKGAILKNITFDNVTYQDNKSIVPSSGAGMGVIAGNVTGKTSMENVQVLNANVKGYDCVGGFVGYVDKAGRITLKNCVNNANIIAIHSYAGGFVAISYSQNLLEISGCTNNGSVRSKSCCGGLMARLHNQDKNPMVKINHCNNYGSVTCEDYIAGGIIGDLRDDNPNMNIQTCNNYGTITGVNDCGGIVGWIMGGASLYECHNEGKVESTGTCAGGIVGNTKNYNIDINSCSNKGEIDGFSAAGGVLGLFDFYNNNAVLYLVNNSNAGRVYSQTFDCGGIVGKINSDVQHVISGNTNQGEVIASASAGGIVGYLKGGSQEISNNDNSGKVESQAAYAGGIIGGIEDDSSAFNHCNNAGEVYGCKQAGGILAYCGTRDHDKVFSFDSCTNNGVITSENNEAAGIVACVDTDADHKITNCVNKANVTAKASTAGGIVASMYGGLANAENNYNYGKIVSEGGSGLAGGICGAIQDDYCTFKNCINYGEIQAEVRGAGIVAIAGNTSKDRAMKFYSCVNKGAVTAKTNDGAGIIATLDTDNGGHVFEDCTNEGAIHAKLCAGGMIGWMVGGSQDFKNNTNKGAIISDTSFAGGLIGGIEDDDFKFEGAYNYANVTGGSHSGGIVGYAGDCKHDPKYEIETGKNTGNILSTGEDAGGAIGLLYTDHDCYISYFENYGNIETKKPSGGYAGGIVATMYGGGSCHDNVNNGDVRGLLAGGMYGWIEDDTVNFYNNKVDYLYLVSTSGKLTINHNTSSRATIYGKKTGAIICAWDGDRGKVLNDNTGSTFSSGKYLIVLLMMGLVIGGGFLFWKKKYGDKINTTI